MLRFILAVFVLFSFSLVSPVSGIASTCGYITQGFGGFEGGLQNSYDFGSAVCVIGPTPDGNTLVAVGVRNYEGPGTTPCTPNNNPGGWGGIFTMIMNDSCWVESEHYISNGCPEKPMCDGEAFGSSISYLGPYVLGGQDVHVIAVGAPGYEAPWKCSSGYTECGSKTCREGGVRILFLTQWGGRVAQGIFSSDDGNSFSDAWKAAGNNQVPITKNSEFGSAVENLGDLDGPGPVHTVLAVGDNSAGGSDTGEVWLLFLDEDYEVTHFKRIREEDGSLGGDLTGGIMFGTSLENLGDVDGSGPSVTALAVGAPRYVDPSTGNQTGSVWVLFLDADGEVLRHTIIPSTGAGLEGQLGDDAGFGGGLLVRPGYPWQLLVRSNFRRIHVVDLGVEGVALRLTTLTPNNTPELACVGTEQIRDGLAWFPPGIAGGSEKLVLKTNGVDAQNQTTGALRVISDFLPALPTTGVDPVAPAAPEGMRLRPNPARGILTATFHLDQGGQTTLEVFDVRGRRVTVQPLGRRDAGTAATELDLRGRAGGVYFLRVTVDERPVTTGRILLIP